jgi:hypothetical protein
MVKSKRYFATGRYRLTHRRICSFRHRRAHQLLFLLELWAGSNQRREKSRRARSAPKNQKSRPVNSSSACSPGSNCFLLTALQRSLTPVFRHLSIERRFFSAFDNFNRVTSSISLVIASSRRSMLLAQRLPYCSLTIKGDSATNISFCSLRRSPSNKQSLK